MNAKIEGLINLITTLRALAPGALQAILALLDAIDKSPFLKWIVPDALEAYFPQVRTAVNFLLDPKLAATDPADLRNAVAALHGIDITTLSAN